VRLAHGIVVFPGGAGTAEEILYLAGILLDPANREQPFPIVLTGPAESAAYFEHISRFIAATLGSETARRFAIIIDDPPEVARRMVRGMDAVRDLTRAVEELGAKAVKPDEIYDVKADVFAPCALGAIINDDTVKRLRVEIVAGGANNQLAETRHGVELEAKGILYAPDYVINGGGVVNVFGELQGWTMERAKRKAQEIYDTLLRVFAIATRDGIPSFEAADRLAEERIRSVAALKRMWIAGDR